MIILPKDRNIHRPPHFYSDNLVYFITCKTIKSLNYFKNNRAKKILLNYIVKNLKLYGLLFGLAILDNHYHLLIKIIRGKNLGKLMNLINGSSSYQLNKLDGLGKRKIWYQYWDKSIRNEKDLYSHLNYIHQNPIKHGLVKNIEELENYKFCTYKDYLKKCGQEWLDDCFRNFPVINYIND